MQDITGRSSVNLLGRNAYSLCTEVTERFRLIQQDDIDSPLIRRFGHRILVTRFAQRRIGHQLLDTVFVLHFTQADQVGYLVLTGSQNHLAYLIQLVVETRQAPSFGIIRQKLVIVFQRIMLTVEQIFDIVFHHAEFLLSNSRSQRATGSQKKRPESILYTFHAFTGI